MLHKTTPKVQQQPKQNDDAVKVTGNKSVKYIIRHHRHTFPHLQPRNIYYKDVKVQDVGEVQCGRPPAAVTAHKSKSCVNFPPNVQSALPSTQCSRRTVQQALHVQLCNCLQSNTLCNAGACILVNRCNATKCSASHFAARNKSPGTIGREAKGEAGRDCI